MTARTRKVGIRLLAATLGLVGTLLAAEIALRALVPDYRNFYVWPPGTAMLFRPSPAVLSGVSDPAHFTINARGIRGRDLPEGPAYRVLAVGGSSTECALLDDKKAWPAMLEARLPPTAMRQDVWVGNVGRSGMNSRDHVVHVKYLPREYRHIDAILVLAGVNDLTVALAQEGHYTPPPPWTAAAAEPLQIRRAFAVAPGR